MDISIFEFAVFLIGYTGLLWTIFKDILTSSQA